jgi:hypothetical protein
MLHGGPGIGKSLMLEHFSRAACAATLTPEKYQQFLEHPSQFLYVVRVLNEFWDSFSAISHVIQFDDFGQFRDSIGQESEASVAIEAGNAFPMPLHMAEITNKGHVFNNCKFMVATSNLSVFNFNSIESNDALDRRWGLRYVMVPKDEVCFNPEAPFMHRKFDYEKLPFKEVNRFTKDHFKVTQLDTDLQSFIEVDAKGKPTGLVHDFDQVVNRMHTEYLKRIAWHEQAISNFTATVNKYRSLYVDADAQAASEDIQMVSLESQRSQALYNLTPMFNKIDALSSIIDNFGKDVKILYEHCVEVDRKSNIVERLMKHARVRQAVSFIYGPDQQEVKIDLLICVLLRDYGPSFYSYYIHGTFFDIKRQPDEDYLDLNIPFTTTPISLYLWNSLRIMSPI